MVKVHDYWLRRLLQYVIKEVRVSWLACWFSSQIKCWWWFVCVLWRGCLDNA